MVKELFFCAVFSWAAGAATLSQGDELFKKRADFSQAQKAIDSLKPKLL